MINLRLEHFESAAIWQRVWSPTNEDSLLLAYARARARDLCLVPYEGIPYEGKYGSRREITNTWCDSLAILERTRLDRHRWFVLIGGLRVRGPHAWMRMMQYDGPDLILAVVRYVPDSGRPYLVDIWSDRWGDEERTESFGPLAKAIARSLRPLR